MHITDNTNQVFTFNEVLDSNFLNEYCDGDLSFCNQLFEAFLSTSDDDINELTQAVSSNNYQSISQIAHKIKPNYSFVGLSADGIALAKIDQQAKAEIIGADIHEIIDSIRGHIKVIEEENKRLVEFLESNN